MRLVEQQPFIKSAQATQLARRRARFNAVIAQVLKESRHIVFRGFQEHTIPAFKELGKDPKVTEICFAGERSQALFYSINKRCSRSGATDCLCSPQFDYPRVNAAVTGRLKNCRTSFIMDSRRSISGSSRGGRLPFRVHTLARIGVHTRDTKLQNSAFAALKIHDFDGPMSRPSRAKIGPFHRK